MTRLPQDPNDFPALGLYNPGVPVAPALSQFLTKDSTGEQVATQAMAEAVAAFIAMGKGYSASTGIISAAASTNNYPLSVFNPSSSGKSLAIYSVQFANGSGGATGLLQMTDTNPAFGSQITPISDLGSGSASALPGAAVTSTATSQSLAGSFKQVATLFADTVEVLTNGAMIVLPAGTNSGLVAYLQSYGVGINSVLIRWVEL
jgi:hypothetical protein